jgi:hypothetical protein
VAPSVSWQTPGDGASLPRGNVSLTASASDGESGVARVEFYVDGALKVTDTTAPHGVTWSAKKRATYTPPVVRSSERQRRPELRRVARRCSPLPRGGYAAKYARTPSMTAWTCASVMPG